MKNMAHMTDKLNLTEELFIGAGGHQATYIHPLDEKKCVKCKMCVTEKYLAGGCMMEKYLRTKSGEGKKNEV